MVEDVFTEALPNTGSLRHPIDDNTIACNFNTMVLDGKLRVVVCTLTSRVGDGILGTDDGAYLILDCSRRRLIWINFINQMTPFYSVLKLILVITV